MIPGGRRWVVSGFGLGSDGFVGAFVVGSEKSNIGAASGVEEVGGAVSSSEASADVALGVSSRWECESAPSEELGEGICSSDMTMSFLDGSNDWVELVCTLVGFISSLDSSKLINSSSCIRFGGPLVKTYFPL